jgi:hypothetical protein
MRAILLLFVLSVAILGVYEFGIGELYKYLGPRFPNDHATWMFLHVYVSSLIAVLLAWSLGVWSREVSGFVKIVGVLVCLVVPPLIVILNIGITCFVLRHCI